MIRIPVVLFIYCFWMLTACDGYKSNIVVSNPPLQASPPYVFEYDFKNPKIIVLDKELVEISGLAYDSKNDVLIAHNDERGHVYQISKTDGTIRNDYKFAKKGDYESVEIIDDTYVICSSAGKLHFYDTELDQTNSVKTKLSQKNDVEGMCLSFDNKNLLLACKGRATKKSKTKKLKSVRAYSLASNTLLDEPYLIIKDHDLVEMVKDNHIEESKSELKKLIDQIRDFAPSGIAIHPYTKDHYLISARGSTLVIFDESKSLKEIIFLDEELIKQPEGICFDQNAILYIGTEGHGLSAKIFKFTKK